MQNKITCTKNFTKKNWDLKLLVIKMLNMNNNINKNAQWKLK